MSITTFSTYSRSERHFMNKPASLLAVAALVAALSVGTVAPAEAHTGDMNVEAVCNTTTGEYDFTATLTVSRSGDKAGKVAARVGTSNFEGTPRSDTGMDFVTEIAGDGVYSLPGFSLPGTTTGSGPWVYAFTSFDRPEQKNSFGSDGRLRYQLAGDCVVPKPDPKEPTVKFGQWQEASIECDATEVATSREVFTTSYVYDENSNTYVEGETVTTVESSVRQLTAEEVEANKCVVVPEKPETIVNATEWLESRYECGATEATQTREVSTTTHTLIDNVWVADPLVITNETQTRDLTAAEAKANVCPTVPVVTQLPTIPLSPELAYTGSTSPLLPIGIGSMLLAVGAFLVRKAVRA